MQTYFRQADKQNLSVMYPRCQYIKVINITDYILHDIQTSYEPRHDKTNIVGVRPAWIQTSLRLRAVWSGSMLFAISFSTCYRDCKRTAWILIRLRGCAGWSGSMLVANPLCWLVLSWRGSYIVCVFVNFIAKVW
jgi:hypothetical protein